jgi:hypothetical protein
MPPVMEEPALRFWLRYAEREGALIEDHGDRALLLLPEALQRTTELPEEASVTASPDVARDERAALLIAGHPAVERAAAAVLTEGDVGSAYGPWPTSRPPARSQLESRARELASIEHGRIDAAGEPIAVYLPLLRVAAMVSYAASLTLRLQEQEEVLLDARTGLEPSERVLGALRDRPWLEHPDGRGRLLEADLERAVAAAHERLEQRACARQSSLAAHARRALESELARADAYYEAALQSIARRRATAWGDRVRLLDGQAQATREERARRRREIEEEHEPRHHIRPFRIHLLYMPAFLLPVEVRRGRRAFPLELAWIAVAGEFAPVRCPACGAAEPLVVTRERLGCRACAAGVPSREVPLPDRTSSARHVERVHPPQPSQPEAPQPESPQPDSRRAPGRPRPPGGAERIRGSKRSPNRAAPTGIRNRGRSPSGTALPRTGNRLAYSFWQHVASGERWPRRKAARDSPLRVLYRLYGNAGPQIAIGIPSGERLDRVMAMTHLTGAGAPELTIGAVTAGEITYDYTISWWLEAGKPVVGEVMPSPHPLVLPERGGAEAEIGARLRERAPAPAIELDPISAALWRVEVAWVGLPFAVRCLATRWRAGHGSEPSPPAAAGAAIASAVARAAGLRRTRAELAQRYGTQLEAIELLEQALEPELRLDRRRGW